MVYEDYDESNKENAEEVKVGEEEVCDSSEEPQPTVALYDNTLELSHGTITYQLVQLVYRTLYKGIKDNSISMLCLTECRFENREAMMHFMVMLRSFDNPLPLTFINNDLQTYFDSYSQYRLQEVMGDLLEKMIDQEAEIDGNTTEEDRDSSVNESCKEGDILDGENVETEMSDEALDIFIAEREESIREQSFESPLENGLYVCQFSNWVIDLDRLHNDIIHCARDSFYEIMIFHRCQFANEQTVNAFLKNIEKTIQHPLKIAFTGNGEIKVFDLDRNNNYYLTERENLTTKLRTLVAPLPQITPAEEKLAISLSTLWQLPEEVKNVRFAEEVIECSYSPAEQMFTTEKEKCAANRYYETLLGQSELAILTEKRKAVMEALEQKQADYSAKPPASKIDTLCANSPTSVALPPLLSPKPRRPFAAGFSMKI